MTARETKTAGTFGANNTTRANAASIAILNSGIWSQTAAISGFR
jgi:hypothetical protein